jgi:electron transfer flavoprotein beta subunit
MRIAVCIKQVPGTNDVQFDPDTWHMKLDSAEVIMNPFDTYALEQGVQLVEQLGGEVIAVSMGGAKVEQTLREALSAGATQAVLLSDPAFVGSDTWATSRILAAAVRKLGNVDLVLCGMQAIDGGSAQVGPAIAIHLGWPQAAFVSSWGESTDTRISVTRMHEEGTDVCEIDLPAVATVVKDINSPRIPSLKKRMAAKRAEISTWTAADLELDSAEIGTTGSPTRITRVYAPKPKETDTMVIEDEPEESARKLLHELRSRTLI